MGGARETAAVADVDEDPGSGPDADPGHGRQDPGKRVSLQQFLDSGGQDFALVEDGAEGSGEAGHDEPGRVGAGNDDGLFVQGGEDVFDQALGHSRGLRTYEGDQPSAPGLAYLGRGSEPFQQHQDGRVLDARVHNSLQVRVNLGQ